jgi:GNAT superfamily N-acetyltransferase
LLARLALSEKLHGQGYGAMLLVEALGVAVDAIRRGGGRLIVLDAIDTRAASFYERHGFVRTPGPGRLVMKASDAAASLGLPWP